MPLSRINSASIDNSAISAADIADGTITAAKIISVANTQITGNIASSQIAPNQTLNGNVSVTGNLTTTGNTILGDASTDTLNVGNGDLIKDASGNVGINIASPSTYGKFVVIGSPNADAGIFIGNASLTGSAPTYKGTVRIIDNPTSATGTSGGLEFLTSTFGSGYGWKMASIDSSGVNLTFSTRQNSASWTEAMRIDSSGNVGIGTASPSVKLETNVASGNIEFRQSVGGVTKGQFISSATDQYIVSGGTGSQQFYVNGTNQATITAAGLFQFNSGYGSVATAYGCRAWVNFNGQGTVAIRASGNVSSITDSGVGAYAINFSTAMPDANYSVVFGNEWSTQRDSGTNGLTAGVANIITGYTTNTSGGGTGADSQFVLVSIFR